MVSNHPKRALFLPYLSLYLGLIIPQILPATFFPSITIHIFLLQ